MIFIGKIKKIIENLEKLENGRNIGTSKNVINYIKKKARSNTEACLL
jgi:hypothetical protein